ncbi:MAG: hypothetical protein IJ688_09995 [Treponema sp.]|uniref:DUF6675 family protein n=1 Tax=Treponema sp. TaxID=166 RepID=UPI0025EFF7B6|nr:DUF6675 family protein [Treponema sp.]MBQ8680497.1 hypothetical protein [Treponema sp.]MBR1639702.1 hypothetical protein [Treponema sp.]
MKRLIFAFTLLFLTFSVYAQVFNEKLSEEDFSKLKNGELLVKNINFQKNMSLNKEKILLGENLFSEITKLSPKYLAEVIQFKPYQGNEDLPARLEETLNNVSDYAGIPYYSEHSGKWYDLYKSAEIVSSKTDGEKKTIIADLIMEPFDYVNERIEITSQSEAVLYIATNTNKLRYLDKFDCIWPEKMKICILLFRDGDNWVLYGLGGANVPRIPFFTERIQTSLINRINTFCTYIFKKF